MAEENKNIVNILEQRKEDAVAAGDVSTAMAIQMKIDYLNSFDDPEDVVRLSKNSKEFQQFVNDVTVGGDLEGDAKKAMGSAPAKSKRREESTANRTFNDEDVKNFAAFDSSVDDVFNPESRFYYQKWSGAQMDEYAKANGMKRGDMMKRMMELDIARQRKAIANDGLAGKFIGIVTPRRQKDIENGEDPSWSSTLLDVAENAAQAVPVGRAIGAAGKLGRIFGKLPKVAQGVAENAVVPSLFAYADAAREGNTAEGTSKAIEGTSVNMATPRMLRMLGSRMRSMISEKVPQKIAGALEKGILQDIATSYTTNKMGKKQYGDRLLNFVAGIDPTGILSDVVENIPGSAKDLSEKDKKKQEELEKKHTEDVVDDYKASFGLAKYGRKK